MPSAFVNTAIALASYNGTADSTVSFENASTYAPLLPTITPFAGYHGPLTTAVGDVNDDGIPDLIVGAQAPDGHVKVFDGATGDEMMSFLSFPGFNGVVNVGAADLTGDGHADILVAANATNAHVKVFSGQDASLLSSFYAFPGFQGQVSVSGADFNDSGMAQIVVGAGGLGADGRVGIFNLDGSAFNSGFFAFPGFSGPISVAAGDVNGDGIPDIVVGAGKGSAGGPVEVFSGAGFGELESFVPFAPTMTDGVDVQLADGNLDGRLDIFVSVHPGGTTPLTSSGLVPVVAYDGFFTAPLGQVTAGPGAYPNTGSGGDFDFNNDLGNTYTYTPTPDPTTYSPPPPITTTTTDPGTDNTTVAVDDGSSDFTDPTPGCTDPGTTDNQTA